MSEPILSIENLCIKSDRSLIRNLSMSVHEGEIVGLIGESGSGKSLSARAVLDLLPKGVNMESGSIHYFGQNLSKLGKRKRRSLAGSEMAMIFQDYRGSFTPYIKMGKQMIEAIRSHQKMSKKEAKERVLRALEEMNLSPERIFSSYPFQLSGGQVQRAAIATVRLLTPSLILCDEVTTALDVISGEIVMDDLEKTCKETGSALLLITHDLSEAFRRADRIYVMHKGEIVEQGPTDKIKEYPSHPYTKKLFSSLLSLPVNVEAERRRVL
ncbi:ABC transporter ATP-binding protein (plasmid) [Pseudalkalibacillus hwajinpoensis]|uniref:ABC transporter ATP-binding protein n=1 Tax=Guptibacillus hwajinpoensis TaxID=208199 RepID=UPI00325B5F6F